MPEVYDVAVIPRKLVTTGSTSGFVKYPETKTDPFTVQSSIVTADIANGTITRPKVNGLSTGEATDYANKVVTVNATGNAFTAVDASTLSGDTITADGDDTGFVKVDKDDPTAFTVQNTVGTDDIANSAITSAKLAYDSVTSNHIENGTIQWSDIGDGQVHIRNLADKAVTNAKLAEGAVTTVKIADDAVQTDQIADGTITRPKLNGLSTEDAETYASKLVGIDSSGAAFTAVDPSTLKGDTITASGDDSGFVKVTTSDPTTFTVQSTVGTDDIADAAVSTVKIATGAVSNSRIADGAVSTAKIADDAVQTGKILDASITRPKLNGLSTEDAETYAGKLVGIDSTGAAFTAVDNTYPITFTATQPGNDDSSFYTLSDYEAQNSGFGQVKSLGTFSVDTAIISTSTNTIESGSYTLYASVQGSSESWHTIVLFSYPNTTVPLYASGYIGVYMASTNSLIGYYELRKLNSSEWESDYCITDWDTVQIQVHFSFALATH